MQSIRNALREQPLTGIGLLLGIMLATRFHNAGAVTHLPDASLAVFFLTGFYYRRAIYMIPLMLLAGGIDYLATQNMGVSDYCLSPAYPFLILTYGVMWYGGRWYAQRHSQSAAGFAQLVASIFVSGSLAFLISNYSFYFFSDRYLDVSLIEHSHYLATLYIPYLSGAALSVLLAATGVMAGERGAASRG